MAEDDSTSSSESSSSDTYTETTSEGWLSRIGGAIKGMLVGLVMTVAAFPLLFWNEGRAVRVAKSLDEGRGAVVTVSSERVEPANEGKLVHTTGRAKTGEILADPVFGVSANALHLKRKVEMYQWKESSRSETREKLGGGTETVTTYTYQRDWSESPIDSSRFKQPSGHQNPRAMPYKSEIWTAGKVTLGAYTLTSAQVGRISGDEPVTASAARVRPEFGRPLLEYSGGFYSGETPDQPRIGDLRISFSMVGETDVTVVARQIGNSFEPYRAKAGSTVDLQRKGIASADEMFTSAGEANVLLTWILRGAGFLLMAIGIGMILKPLSVLASVLPILGDIVGAGTGIIAFLLSGVLSLVTIAIAWIFYRPLLGIVLLVVGGGLVCGVMHLIRKARAARAVPAAQPQSP
jgi:hypothetical protein